MKKYLFLLLCIPWTVWANAQEVQVISQNIPKQTNFAQPFEVRFSLSHTPGYTPHINKESLPKDFELIGEQSSAPDSNTFQYQGTFLPFTIGASTFTAVNIQLMDAQGNAVAQTHTTPQTITVQPVQYFKDQNIRDIRPPYIPSGWFWWVLCLIAALILTYLLRRGWKHLKEQAAAAAEAADNRPADVIALSKIQLLLQSGLWEKEQYKLFYIELGEILREYFWRRFQLDVSADTSAELIRRARQVADLAPLLALLRDYLSSSDLVKFAQVIPSETTMNQDVSALQTIIKQTTPVSAQKPSEEDL